MEWYFEDDVQGTDDEMLLDCVEEADRLYQEVCLWQSRLTTFGTGTCFEPYLLVDVFDTELMLDVVKGLSPTNVALWHTVQAKLLHVIAACELEDSLSTADVDPDSLSYEAHYVESSLREELDALRNVTGIDSLVMVARAKALHAHLLGAIEAWGMADWELREALGLCIPAVREGSKEALLLQSDMLVQRAILDPFDPDAVDYYEMAADGYAYFDEDPNVLFREERALSAASHAYAESLCKEYAELMAQRAAACAQRLVQA